MKKVLLPRGQVSELKISQALSVPTGQEFGTTVNECGCRMSFIRVPSDNM